MGSWPPPRRSNATNLRLYDDDANKTVFIPMVAKEELIGGIEPAREYVLAALAAGRPVVTANKQLIAQHGGELFSAARDAGVQLRFEAAVAGAMPRCLASSATARVKPHPHNHISAAMPSPMPLAHKLL